MKLLSMQPEQLPALISCNFQGKNNSIRHFGGLSAELVAWHQGVRGTKEAETPETAFTRLLLFIFLIF